MTTTISRRSSSLPILLLSFWLCSLPLLAFANPQLAPRRLALRCRGSRGRIVQREFDWAMMMLANANQMLARPNGVDNHYFRTFFAPATTASMADEFARHLQQRVLTPLEAIPKPGTRNFTLTVRCRQTGTCRRGNPLPDGRQRHRSAYYNSVLRQVNFCDLFFDQIPPTDEMLCDRTNSRLLEGYRTKGLTPQMFNSRF